ncbi:MAG: hypothetical protein JW888_06585 [Pirellulales bacterium]|nr:hypothetical protein [Pirellulales bacterium]
MVSFTRHSINLSAVMGLMLLNAIVAVGQTVSVVQPTFDPMLTAEVRADARLHDVCFVSPLLGWAVGDRGAIWHTNDGGQHWRLQRSGVGCPLRSVCFLDERVGWIAGGFSHPYRHGSTGVLLMTENGGETWTPTSKLMLPAIRKVRFFDKKTGIALGDASAMFPSGFFATKTGGLDWRAVPGDHLAGWTTGDLIDSTTGALAGRQGNVAVVRRGAIETERSPSFGLRTLRNMQLLRPTWGWLVGDGALIMLTGDLGLSWQSTPGTLPEGIDQNFDFTALAVRGPRCWVAGSPGTRVLQSEDAGQSWIASATGQNVPIHAITFVDDQRGWAVGSLGTILATQDGGRTWQRQHTGGTRAALVGFFSRPSDVPLELLAQLSGNEGYLGVVEVLNRRDLETRPRGVASLEDRLREAIVRLGASDAAVAWRFPLEQPGLGLGDQAIVELWNRANDGRGLEMLQAHLVRQIRLWRPEVIVTHGTDPTGDDPQRYLINRAVLEAVGQASDPTSHVNQITHAGLEPWQVKRVYASVPNGTKGEINLSEAQLAQRLGRSLGEVAADARGLLENEFTPGPVTLGFRLMLDRLDQAAAQDDFFSRIVLQPGGDARRNLANLAPETLASLQRLAQKRRNVRAILRSSEEGSLGGPQLLAQSGELTRGMDDGSAAQVMYHLAQQYYRRGQWPLAAETFEMLVDRCPEHALAGEALAWLVQYHASAEAAWREQGTQRGTIQTSGARSASIPSIDRDAERGDRPAKAARFAKQIERTRPALFAEPEIGFPLSVADRMRGFPGQAERFLMNQRRREEHDAWWRCAQGESWLSEPTGEPPKPILRCVVAAVKPKLDGHCDEPFWQRAQGAAIGGRQGNHEPSPAIVKLAYDDQFLYLACRCPQAPGAEDAVSSGPRERDADLSSHDRVDVLLDLDRDYVTCYRLTVDHRGWTGEDCWGDASWNPTWFVAAAAERGTWTVEAAIPLDQLTGRYPHSGDVWGLGAQRVIPGLGFQSWNTPASTTIVPEGFGYLVFE